MIRTKTMVEFGVVVGFREEDEFEDGISVIYKIIGILSLKMMSGYMIFIFEYSFSYLYLI